MKIFSAFLLLALLLGLYTFVEPYWISIRELSFIDSDVPAAFEGTSIVFVSDIHHGPFFSLRRVKRLVERINRLQPDIVIFGGDYVHREEKYIVPCFEELRHVRAKRGKFGVLGNHDHWADSDRSLYWLDRTGQNIRHGCKPIYKGRYRIFIGTFKSENDRIKWSTV